MRRSHDFACALLAASIFIFWPCRCFAGPNAGAGCALDMDIGTRNYTSEISGQDIETDVSVDVGETFFFLVVAQNVSNLDTYNFDIVYDPAKLDFVKAYQEDLFGNLGVGEINNILKINGGNTIGFRSEELVDGVVNIANALTYGDKDEAPEGSGVLAILQFESLQGDDCGQIELSDVKFIDSDGVMADPIVQDSITRLTNASYNYQAIRAVETMGDCPADAECFVGIAAAWDAIDECGRLKIVGGDYYENIVSNKNSEIIFDDPNGPVNLFGPR